MSLSRAKKTEEGFKDDGGKAPLDLLHPIALTEIAKALGYGAKKYSRFNYLLGMAWSRPYAAAQRHLNEWNNGVTFDKESGLRHLAHAAVSIMFLIVYEVLGIGTDDRIGVFISNQKKVGRKSNE